MSSEFPVVEGFNLSSENAVFSSPTEYPYIGQVIGPAGNFKCEAAFITTYFALASARCLLGSSVEEVRVVVISSGIKAEGGNVKNLTFNVIKIIGPPINLSHINHTHEQGLIILALKWGEHNHDIQLARFSTNHTAFSGNATFLHWVQVYLNSALEWTLEKFVVSILNTRDCKARFNITADEFLCVYAHDKNSWKQSSQGILLCSDEFGPYLCGFLAEEKILIYKEEESLKLFLSLGANNFWIEDQISKLGCHPGEGWCQDNLTSPPTCEYEEHFRCKISQECLAAYHLCDGKINCGNYITTDTSDEDNCRSAGGCHELQFPCETGNKCIHHLQRCDGIFNCKDASDELNCPYRPRKACGPGEFQCHLTPRCISTRNLCDGEYNCLGKDQSDEENCRSKNGCHPMQFPCRGGNACVPAHAQCDGNADCSDGSDEENCFQSNCSSSQLKCQTKSSCYELKDICDQKMDCGVGDYSDSEKCTSGTRTCPWTYFDCKSTNGCVKGTNICNGKKACDDGSDEDNCDDPSGCHWTQFPCRNESKKCIPANYVCDGTSHCADSSDEDHCNLQRCHWSEYRCLDGQCIPGHGICNGQRNCLDGSDETFCACAASQLQCSVTKRCYSLNKICNQVNDCGLGDTTDEDNCPLGISGCAWTDFACKNDRRCVRGSLKCNGRNDCTDGSDEGDCEGGDKCHWTQFMCRNDSACVGGNLRCDGRYNCKDGSDEENCIENRCHWSEFRCKEEDKCLPGYFTCDGTKHCGDGSDEKNCGGAQGHVSLMYLEYLSIPGGIIFILGISLIYLHRKYRKQQGRLTSLEIKLFEKGDENQLRCDKSAHENAQFIPYNREYEIKWRDFQIKENEKLGEGAYGIVHKGYVSTKQVNAVAVKTVKSDVEKSIILALLSELKVMIHLGKHENIIELIGACTEYLKEGRVYVMVEYCPMGSLESVLRRCTTQTEPTPVDDGYVNPTVDSVQGQDLNEILKYLPMWAIQIARGMQHLQNKKVIHGDLATRNILLFSMDRVKITDFGLSRQLLNYDNYVKKSQAMLPWRWLALETLKSMVFSHKSDVWSYGVTLWEIFSMGLVPYPGMVWSADFVSQLEGNLRLPRPQYASEEMYGIILKCWELEPEQRPDFQELERRLEELSKF